MKQQENEPTAKNFVPKVILWLPMVFVFYVLSFGPAWGLHKHGHIFPKIVIRVIYMPLVKVADRHICRVDWPGQLLWRYAEFCAPSPNPKILSADNTFD